MTAIGIVRIGMIALGGCQRKDENDDADDKQLFEERVAQRVNRPVNEIRAVVRRHDLDSGRELDFTPPAWLSPAQSHRVRSAVRTMTVPPVTSPSPFQLRDAAPHAGPSSTRATSRYPDRCSIVADRKRRRF